MLELLSTIAILCQVQTGANLSYGIVENNQRRCQVEYIRCVGVNDMPTSYGGRLAKCIAKGWSVGEWGSKGKSK